MNIFEKQEMSKSQSRVKEELKGWYDWSVIDFPEPIKEKASMAFKTCKDEIMGLFQRAKSEKEPKEDQNEGEEQNEESLTQ